MFWPCSNNDVLPKRKFFLLSLTPFDSRKQKFGGAVSAGAGHSDKSCPSCAPAGRISGGRGGLALMSLPMPGSIRDGAASLSAARVFSFLGPTPIHIHRLERAPRGCPLFVKQRLPVRRHGSGRSRHQLIQRMRVRARSFGSGDRSDAPGQ